MKQDLFERVLIQLHPDLAQEFIFATIEDAKKLKALEIIKEKKVDIATLLIEKCDLKIYNEFVIPSLGELPLTEKEFDLIFEEVIL